LKTKTAPQKEKNNTPDKTQTTSFQETTTTILEARLRNRPKKPVKQHRRTENKIAITEATMIKTL